MRSFLPALVLIRWIFAITLLSLPVKGQTFDTPVECQEIIQELTRDEDWFEQLVDPTLTSKEQISKKITLYSEIDACLQSDPGLLPGQAQMVRQHIHTFLVFTDQTRFSPGAFTFDLVDLNTADDPAVIELRDEAGIPAPQGFIFVHTYPSQEEMPGIIKRGFVNNKVAGITMYSRYVAILADQNQSWPELLLESQTVPKTLSHELVHAYINSILGIDNYTQTPKWWEEGIAIYFSGSGEEHTVVTPNLTITSTSPDEYKEYQLIFEFLEDRLGRQQLLDLIRESVLQADPTLLYKALEIQDEDALFAAARQWQSQVLISRSVMVIAAAVLVFWLLYRRLPEYRCQNCGYEGNKKQFSQGYCPRCFYPTED